MNTDLDDKTFALLLAVSDLMERSDSPSHIVTVWNRSVKQVQEYRETEGQLGTRLLP